MVEVFSKSNGIALQKQIQTLRKKNRKLQKRIAELNKFFKSISIETTKLKNPRCPKCNSWKVTKRGIRKTVERGGIQKYYCQDCNWKFSPHTIDFRMRHNKETINKILDLRKEGKSSSQIADATGNIMARQSVMRILHKFQKPTQEVTIKRKQRNQYGEYEREFKIKI